MADRPNKSSIVHGLDSYTDLSTGKRYAYGTDEEVTSHLDEETKRQLLKQLAPRQAGVVGNFADVQRGGAAVLKDGGDMADGVEPPPDRTAEQIQKDAKVAEKVEGALDDAFAAVTDAEKDAGAKKASGSTKKS
jgi:hypothetical protein